MYKNLLIIAVISCSLPAFAGPARLSHDAKLMQGEWVPVKWELGGSPTPPTTMSAMRLTLKGDQYEFVEGPSHDFGRFALRPGQIPKQMQISGVKGPNAGRTIPAIYHVYRNRLTICYGLDGHRPHTFRSPKKSMVLLVVFSRRP